MNENKELDQHQEEYNKYNPNQMKFPEFNLVNTSLNQRKIIIKNFGNFHDSFALNQFIKSLNNKNNMNNNKNKNKNKNNNNNYRYKSNRRRHFR